MRDETLNIFSSRSLNCIAVTAHHQAERESDFLRFRLQQNIIMEAQTIITYPELPSKPPQTTQPGLTSPKFSRTPTTVWSQLRLWHYQFELTFGPYVMDTGEKIAFYFVLFALLAAILFAAVWTFEIFIGVTKWVVLTKPAQVMAFERGRKWAEAVNMVDTEWTSTGVLEFVANDTFHAS